MNRQIKFRAKTTANGHWVYGSLVDYGNGNMVIVNKKSNPWVIPSSVGQFTGLTDKNGTEIYEGDVLIIQDEDYSLPEKVIFEDGCFMADDGLYKYDFSTIDTEYRTVIGNIHDDKTKEE